MTVRTRRGQEKSAFGQEFDDAHRENSGRAPSVPHREVASRADVSGTDGRESEKHGFDSPTGFVRWWGISSRWPALPFDASCSYFRLSTLRDRERGRSPRGGGKARNSHGDCPRKFHVTIAGSLTRQVIGPLLPSVRVIPAQPPRKRPKLKRKLIRAAVMAPLLRSWASDRLNCSTAPYALPRVMIDLPTIYRRSFQA